jgi:hypothetical protein
MPADWVGMPAGGVAGGAGPGSPGAESATDGTAVGPAAAGDDGPGPTAPKLAAAKKSNSGSAIRPFCRTAPTGAPLCWTAPPGGPPDRPSVVTMSATSRPFVVHASGATAARLSGRPRPASGPATRSGVPDRTIGPSVRNTAVSATDGGATAAEGPAADGPAADGPAADGPAADGPAADGPAANRDDVVAVPSPTGGASGPPGTPSGDASVIRGMNAVWASASGARCRPEFAALSGLSEGTITRQPARIGGHSTRRTPALSRSSRRFPDSRVRSRRRHRGIVGHLPRTPTPDASLWVRLSP